MKKIILFVLVLLVIFGALAFVVNYQNKEKVDETNNPYGKEDLKQATIDQLDNELYQNQIVPEDLAEKLDNGEDMTVYFYSPTCIHCIRTTPEMVPVAEEYGVNVVKVNVLEFEAPWETYSINGTPTLIHFEDGKEAARVEGAQTESSLKPFFEQEMISDD